MEGFVWGFVDGIRLKVLRGRRVGGGNMVWGQSVWAVGGVRIMGHPVPTQHSDWMNLA